MIKAAMLKCVFRANHLRAIGPEQPVAGSLVLCEGGNLYLGVQLATGHRLMALDGSYEILSPDVDGLEVTIADAFGVELLSEPERLSRAEGRHYGWLLVLGDGPAVVARSTEGGYHAPVLVSLRGGLQVTATRPAFAVRNWRLTAKIGEQVLAIVEKLPPS